MGKFRQIVRAWVSMKSNRFFEWSWQRHADKINAKNRKKL